MEQQTNIKFWLACSGGVDSVVLAHLLYLQKTPFGILHCNFNLRGTASKQDEDFVRRLATDLACPLRVQTFDTRKVMQDLGLNMELAARKLRYDWFHKIIKEEAKVILLAQHYDDQIETFFLQLQRGGKVRGLAAMPTYKNGFLRPLLKYRKQELIDLAKKNGWEWREDLSNRDIQYKRNFYRHQLIPYLKKIDFPLDEAVDLVTNFQELLHFFERFDKKKEITKKEWEAWPIWYREYQLSVNSLGNIPEKEIGKLLSAERGKFIGNNVAVASSTGSGIVFIKKEAESSDNKELKIESVNSMPSKFSEGDSIYIDGDKVELPLQIRAWKSGDYFRPLGMKGQKKIGKFLRDKKVPSHQKNRHQILQDAAGNIVGIFGFGVGEDYKVAEKTGLILKATIS